MNGSGILLATASFGFCVAGLGTLVQGAMVPVEAHVGQVKLERQFEAHRGDGRAPPSPPWARATPAISLPLSSRTPVAARVESSAIVRTPVESGPVARISVKRLRVREVVIAGEPTRERLAQGPMVIRQADAESPVTILAAHRDTHFEFVRDLREGDLMTVEHVGGAIETYRVTHFQTVRWNAFAYPLDPPRPLLALTTCYPFGGTEYGGPWRRVAWAEKIG